MEILNQLGMLHDYNILNTKFNVSITLTRRENNQINKLKKNLVEIYVEYFSTVWLCPWGSNQEFEHNSPIPKKFSVKLPT